MGFNFKKRIKIAPGINLNLTSKGISSVSVGGKVARINIGKNGTRTTASIPGTGVSYTRAIISGNTPTKGAVDKPVVQPEPNLISFEENVPARKVGILHAVAIFFMPYIFAWPLLQSGYSKKSRYISFGWFFLLICVTITQKT